MMKVLKEVKFWLKDVLLPIVGVLLSIGTKK